MSSYKTQIDPLSFSFISSPNQKYYTHRWAGSVTNHHQHVDFYEISLIANGSYTHTIGKSTDTVSQGTLLFFDIGVSHKLTSSLDSTSTHFTMCLTKSYFQLLTQLFSIKPNLFVNEKYHKVELTDIAYQYLLALANMLSNQSPDEEKIIKLFFHNAIHLLIDRGNNIATLRGDFIDDIIEKICNYTYLTISTQEIYSFYPYSIPTIIKNFKERTGTTISLYRAKIRLEYAARLLRETNYTIDSIVANIGFLSTGHFFEVFKEHYGVSPNTYRKNNKIQ